MFNGIIFNQGIVKKINRQRNGINLYLKSNLKVTRNDIGSSICCDGVCLTLVSVKKNVFEFYLSKETINKSKFKNIKVGDKINLELSLKYGQKISGHICQGHVDTVCRVFKIKIIGKSKVMKFKFPKKIKSYLVEKASILINGVSLTISKISKDNFEVWVIPHTIKLTNLSKLKINELVNIEIDILSKYVKKYFYEKK